jgi:hypothetical protein
MRIDLDKLVQNLHDSGLSQIAAVLNMFLIGSSGQQKRALSQAIEAAICVTDVPASKKWHVRSVVTNNDAQLTFKTTEEMFKYIDGHKIVSFTCWYG